MGVDLRKNVAFKILWFSFFYPFFENQKKAAIASSFLARRLCQRTKSSFSRIGFKNFVFETNSFARIQSFALNSFVQKQSFCTKSFRLCRNSKDWKLRLDRWLRQRIKASKRSFDPFQNLIRKQSF